MIIIIIIIIIFFFFFLILIIFIIHHDGHDHQALSCIKHANVAWRVYPAHLFLFTLSLHLEVRSAASEQLRHTKPCPLLLWADAKDSMLYKEQPDLFPRTMNSKYVFIYKPLSAFTHAFVLQYFHSYFMAVFCTIDWFRSYSYSLLLKNIQTWSPNAPYLKAGCLTILSSMATTGRFQDLKRQSLMTRKAALMKGETQGQASRNHRLGKLKWWAKEAW